MNRGNFVIFFNCLTFQIFFQENISNLKTYIQICRIQISYLSVNIQRLPDLAFLRIQFGSSQVVFTCIPYQASFIIQITKPYENIFTGRDYFQDLLKDSYSLECKT